ncbi:hypothetical protein NE237_015114 [Protea cynaroides]|uniref:Uncharacterized protein n=1 Tax=Protea cynaroides TaxID=273540 RepID=A0A9Q0QQS0_9MAGN|nr:hypothetical protein NE237_015114 [Protea cynaroides]
MASLKTEFISLVPTGKSAAEDLAQRDKLFMVLTLAAISPDLAPVRDQILAGFGIHIVPDNVHEAPIDALPAPDSSPWSCLLIISFPLPFVKVAQLLNSKGLGFGKKKSKFSTNTQFTDPPL